MRVDQCCVETLSPHEGFRAVGGAAALAADAEQIDVIAHDVADVDQGWVVRKGCEADFSPTIAHARRVVDRVRRA